jgi:hypothetical protein
LEDLNPQKNVMFGTSPVNKKLLKTNCTIIRRLTEKKFPFEPQLEKIDLMAKKANDGTERVLLDP